MASSLYKNYLIVTAADFHRETSEWKPWVSISWRADGREFLHTIKFSHERFGTAEEAEQFGMQQGEMWISDWRE